MEPPCNGQFSSKRQALFFTPGTYNVNVNVGYYTTVHGLGRHPRDTSVQTLQCTQGAKDPNTGALNNFWRSASNLHTPNNMMWAVSQAAPMRRIVVDGNLSLFQYIPPYPNAGYASGGFMADCSVSGTVTSGSQQQWVTRNSAMQQWKTGVWNIVFVGCTGAPASHCSHTGGSPYTTVQTSPLVVEQPYIIQENGLY